jgi:hypothetical protein
MESKNERINHYAGKFACISFGFMITQKNFFCDKRIFVTP